MEVSAAVRWPYDPEGTTKEKKKKSSFAQSYGPGTFSARREPFVFEFRCRPRFRVATTCSDGYIIRAEGAVVTSNTMAGTKIAPRYTHCDTTKSETRCVLNP